MQRGQERAKEGRKGEERGGEGREEDGRGEGRCEGRCEGGGQTQRGNDREERGGSHAGREVPVHAAGVQGCRGVKGREGAIRGASLA